MGGKDTHAKSLARSTQPQVAGLGWVAACHLLPELSLALSQSPLQPADAPTALRSSTNTSTGVSGGDVARCSPCCALPRPEGEAGGAHEVAGHQGVYVLLVVTRVFIVGWGCVFGLAGWLAG